MCYVAATTDGVLRVTVCAVDSSGTCQLCAAALACGTSTLPPVGSIGAAVVTPERAWVQWEILRDCVAGPDPS